MVKWNSAFSEEEIKFVIELDIYINDEMAYLGGYAEGHNPGHTVKGILL